MKKNLKTIKFIDLFAGLGGFHHGLSRLTSINAKCVFASELNEQLRGLYKSNFGMQCAGDITQINAEDIPRHDLICAGFPCQPFSKAGKQAGLECERNGNLFADHLMRIVNFHKPKYLLLENVPNLLKHDGGETWKTIERTLEESGYSIEWKILSPHKFDIPQIRKRMYIVASRSRKGLQQFDWPAESDQQPSIESVLENKPQIITHIPKKTLVAIKHWNKFVKRYPKDWQLPSFPIWAREFGATYPAEQHRHPLAYQDPGASLIEYKGSFGRPMRKIDKSERLTSLPSYAQSDTFPSWKVRYIEQNRNLYKNLRKHSGRWIDEWRAELVELDLYASLQKLEWNCQNEKRDIRHHILQIRASGIRVKRKTTAPALVATTTQVPIIGWQDRYMTVRECAALQHLEDLQNLPEPSTQAYKALGNAVNSEMIHLIANELFNSHMSNGSRKQHSVGVKRSVLQPT